MISNKSKGKRTAFSAGGQLNSLSIVSISSSSDPSYRMTGMVTEVLWQLPKVLGRVEKCFNIMAIKNRKYEWHSTFFTPDAYLFFKIGSIQNITS